MIENKEAGMTLIVKTITRLTVGLIMLYGIYMVFNGHLSPGGGFAGGVIIALSFIHLMLAFGKEVVLKKINISVAYILISVGVLMFLGVSLLGFIDGQFFSNFFFEKKLPFNLLADGNIPLYEISIGLIVGMGLFIIFVALVLLHKIDKYQK